MEEEYIIISKTAIQKRIEDLEKQRDEYSFNPNRTDDYYRYILMIKLFKEILSQSTPLIPIIEDAFNTGFHKGYNVGQNDCQSHPLALALTIANHIHNDRQNYISNLKLNI